MVPRTETRNVATIIALVFGVAIFVAFTSLEVHVSISHAQEGSSSLGWQTMRAANLSQKELSQEIYRQPIPPSALPRNHRQQEYFLREGIKKKLFSRQEPIMVAVLLVLCAVLISIYAFSQLVVQPIVGAIAKACESLIAAEAFYTPPPPPACPQQAYAQPTPGGDLESTILVDAIAVPLVPAWLP